MNKTTFALPLLTALILSVSLSACAPKVQPQSATMQPPLVCPTPVPPAVVEPAAQPLLYGLWMKEQESQSALITFTEKSVYLVEYDSGGDGYVRETFYEVRSTDWVNGVLALQMKWIRINGKVMGFDDPAKLMKVSMDGETLFYSIDSEELGAPAEAVTGPWVRR
jgi:hypothetical protein